jgi:hypothetical protein
MVYIPELVLIKIFNYLSVKDLCKLKLVCKLWYDLIDCVDSKILCCYTARFPFNLEWSNEKKINKDDFVKLNVLPKNLHFIYNHDSLIHYPYHYTSFNSSLNKPILRKLKKLCLFDMVNITTNLIEQLNNLEYLEELMMDNCEIDERISLKIKNLKVLNLNSTINKFDYHCPNLKKIIISNKVNKVDKIGKNYYADKIEFIKIDTFNPKYCRCFINLKIIICNFIRLEPFNFQIYSKLEQIHIYGDHQYLHNFFSLFKKIERQMKKSKGSNFKIFINGFAINEFENIYSTYHYEPGYLESKENKIATNYRSLIGNTNWPTSFNYSYLLKGFSQNIPNSLFEKFSKIKSIYVKEMVDELKLFEFLIKCNCEKLFIKCDLNQEFYNKLHRLETLDCLSITHTPDFKINFDFILNMNNLLVINLKTNHLDIDLISDAFHNLSFLSIFSCSDHFQFLIYIRKDLKKDFSDFYYLTFTSFKPGYKPREDIEKEDLNKHLEGIKIKLEKNNL